jgi:hypothetical protein
MPRRLALAFAVLLLGCPKHGDGHHPTDISQHVCSGQVAIVVEDSGKQTVGDLVCDDVCDDGTPCREMMNDAKDHAWCGCPGQPEPILCHLSKDFIDGEWGAHCGEMCPVATDRCNMTTVQSLTDAGMMASCDCEAANDY